MYSIDMRTNRYGHRGKIQMAKTTGDLMDALQYPEQPIQAYWTEHADAMIDIDLKAFWHELVQRSGMSKSDIINKSDFGYVYFYDVINGKKNPSRDKIVKLILSMQLTLEDCQTALKYCGRSILYPRVKRDSILIYGLVHRLSVFEVSEMLEANGEAELK